VFRHCGIPVGDRGSVYSIEVPGSLAFGFPILVMARGA
jgi:hypothetical protein